MKLFLFCSREHPVEAGSGFRVEWKKRVPLIARKAHAERLFQGSTKGGELCGVAGAPQRPSLSGIHGQYEASSFRPGLSARPGRPGATVPDRADIRSPAAAPMAWAYSGRLSAPCSRRRATSLGHDFCRRKRTGFELLARLGRSLSSPTRVHRNRARVRHFS